MYQPVQHDMHGTLCCRIKTNNVNDAWIGLTKTLTNCEVNCLRSDWTWTDGSLYTYPGFHNWTRDEPHVNEGCVRLTPNGWLGRGCSTTFAYFCEKVKESIYYFFLVCTVNYADAFARLIYRDLFAFVGGVNIFLLTLNKRCL